MGECKNGINCFIYNSLSTITSIIGSNKLAKRKEIGKTKGFKVRKMVEYKGILLFFGLVFLIIAIVSFVIAMKNKSSTSAILSFVSIGMFITFVLVMMFNPTLTEVENQKTEEFLLDTTYLVKLDSSGTYIISSMVNNQEAFAYKYYNENNMLYDGRIPSYNVKVIYIDAVDKPRLEKYLYKYYDTGRFEGEEEGYKLYIPKNSIMYL